MIIVNAETRQVTVLQPFVGIVGDNITGNAYAVEVLMPQSLGRDSSGWRVLSENGVIIEEVGQLRVAPDNVPHEKEYDGVTYNVFYWRIGEVKESVVSASRFQICYKLPGKEWNSAPFTLTFRRVFDKTGIPDTIVAYGQAEAKLVLDPVWGTYYATCDVELDAEIVEENVEYILVYNDAIFEEDQRFREILGSSVANGKTLLTIKFGWISFQQHGTYYPIRDITTNPTFQFAIIAIAQRY